MTIKNAFDSRTCFVRYPPSPGGDILAELPSKSKATEHS